MIFAQRRAVFVISIVGLLGCVSRGPTVTEIPVWDRHPFVAGCSIFDSHGALLWSDPNWLCVFFPDGRFLSGNAKRIVLHGPHYQRIWQREVPAHHMISIASNGDILALSAQMESVSEILPALTEVSEYLGPGHQNKVYARVPKKYWHKPLRMDKLLRLDMSGRVVAEKILGSFSNYPLTRLKVDFTTHDDLWKFEVSHLNSIYEIPPNVSKIPAFKAGNVLVNDSTNHKVFIVDRDFKTILWHLNMSDYGYQVLHDVQILPSGNLLFFKNGGLHADDSSLEEFDPVRGRVEWRYFAQPEGTFRTEIQGSVQKLTDDFLLFADLTGAKSMAKIISPEGREVWSVDMTQHFDRPMQGVYQLPVEEFLRNNLR